MHCRWFVCQFSSSLTFSVLGLSVNGSRNSSSDWPLSIWRSGRTKDRKRKTTTMNAMSITIAICTGASGLTFGKTNSLLRFGARELCGQLTCRQGSVAYIASLPESLRKPLIFLEAGPQRSPPNTWPRLKLFTNQVAAKNRLIGGRVLQSRGELDGVASP